MRLTDRTDYALRVLMLLAASGKRCSVPDMAAGLDVSAHHLTKVVQSLQACGWVVTTPGRAGGVELGVDPARLSVAEVIRRIEPDLGLVACLRDDGACVLEGPCRLSRALRDARRAFLQALDEVSVGDLVHRRASELVHLGLERA